MFSFAPWQPSAAIPAVCRHSFLRVLVFLYPAVKFLAIVGTTEIAIQPLYDLVTPQLL